MATITLYIKKHQSVHEHLIYLKYNHKGEYRILSTGIKGSIQDFNWIRSGKNDQIKRDQPFKAKVPGYTSKNTRIKSKIGDLERAIEVAEREGDLSVEHVKNVHANLFKRIELTLMEGVDEVLGVLDGILSKTSYRNYTSVKYHLTNFFDVLERKKGEQPYNQAKANYYLTDMNERFDSLFRFYLINDSKLSASSQDKQIKFLKAVLTKLQDRGHEVNMDFKKFKRISTQYLKNPLYEDEVNKIYSYEPSRSSLVWVRDLFVLQCQIGLRIGDFKRLDKGLINNGDLMIRSEKTAKEMRIPLTSLAIEILEKYNYQIPDKSAQKYNDYLKELLKEVGINRKIEHEGKQFQFHEKVSSHVAKKTFITNALRKGLDIMDVAAITGTTRETIYKHYASEARAGEIREKLVG